MSRYIPETFEVPVCAACGTQLDRIHKVTKRITIFLAALLGLLLGLVFLVKGVHADNLFLGIVLMLWVTLFGAILGAVGGLVLGLIIQEGVNYEFCSFNGQYYHFKNKKFRREFAKLNPTMVKQTMK
jgi:branched-subunit amino acid ABC-type transport system permease component